MAIRRPAARVAISVARRHHMFRVLPTHGLLVDLLTVSATIGVKYDFIVVGGPYGQAIMFISLTEGQPRLRIPNQVVNPDIAVCFVMRIVDFYGELAAIRGETGPEIASRLSNLLKNFSTPIHPNQFRYSSSNRSLVCQDSVRRYGEGRKVHIPVG